jgi:hypothetical protein
MQQTKVNTTRQFFELLDQAAAPLTIYSHCEIWKGRQWTDCRVPNPDYGARWVHEKQKGRYAYASAATNGQQTAAAVKLVARSAAVDLATFVLPPTFAVVSANDQPLYAIWAFSEPVRWYASNLSHAIARRLGASATARIPVAGTREWPLTEPYRLVEVTETPYVPAQLEARLRSLRCRPAASTR